MPAVFWTIGHSTRPIEEFIDVLGSHGILCLLDVRLIPYSRRNPQFNSDVLPSSLADSGIRYHALPSLGGRRRPRPDSINQGWRNAGFRGYADYMQTEPFWAGIEELINLAGERPTALMCAEAVPWRCHRSLIADAMVSRGWTVRHILTASKADAHVLTSFAQVADGKVFYPKIGSTSRLF